jgi:uncharacterized alpha-E superfamily protein
MSLRGKRTMTNHGLLAQRHAPQGLISRVADCCFWFGRYVERAEAIARSLQATLNLALDGELAAEQCWQPAVIVTGESADFAARFGPDAYADGEAVQHFLVWDEACAVSLKCSIAGARENARSMREVLSGDVWEIVNEAYLWLGTPAAEEEWRTQRDGFYRRVRQLTQLCLGLLRSTMLHDTALDFIWLGVMLERANQTARLLDVHHHAFAGMAGTTHQVVETSVWLALLRACSGVEPFMKTHTGRVTAERVVRFLVGDSRFPRSVTYAVHAAYERFCYLRPMSDVGLPGEKSLLRLAALDAWLQDRSDADLVGPGLHAVLTHIVDETAAVASLMGQELLGYGPSPETTTTSEG